MAIDRDLINKQIFNGTRPPLDGWVSPGRRRLQGRRLR